MLQGGDREISMTLRQHALYRTVTFPLLFIGITSCLAALSASCSRVDSFHVKITEQKDPNVPYVAPGANGVSYLEVHVKNGQGFFLDPRWGYSRKCSVEEIYNEVRTTNTDGIYLWGIQDPQGVRDYANALAAYIEARRKDRGGTFEIAILHKVAIVNGENPIE